MKKFISFLTTASLLISLMGCSSVGTNGTEGSSNQPNSDADLEVTLDENSIKEVQEVTFWHYFSEVGSNVFDKYVAEFNELYDGEIKVIAEYVPRAELMKRYAIGAVSGDLPDMGMVDGPDHASYSTMGILEDITDLYNEWDEANFLEGTINSSSYNGRIYGLPQSSNCLALYYDIDAFEAAGLEPPVTWDDLEHTASILSDPSKGVYGLAICAIGNEEGTFQLIPWLESAGSFDELNSEGSISSLEFLNGLIENGSMSREIINWTQSDVQKQFSSGSAVMMINGPWQISAIKSDSPDKNYGVVKVPTSSDGDHASCLGGENFVICKGGNKVASWEFLKWICGKEISGKYTRDLTLFSPRSDIDSVALYEGDEIMQLFAEVLSTAKARGPHPNWPEISAAIYTAEQEVFTGKKDAQTAMNDAQEKIKKYLD